MPEKPEAARQRFRSPEESNPNDAGVSEPPGSIWCQCKPDS